METHPAWSAGFEPPAPPRTDRIVLEPLGEHVVELDYIAIMGSRARLRTELQWGGWPKDDFTLKGNREDLAEHRVEFEKREAYAYTVLSADRKRCVGCIYLEPEPGGARFAFWVIDEEVPSELELHLVRTVLGWLESEWTFARVVVPLRPENPRGIALAESLGLQITDHGGLPEHNNFVWHRDG